MQYKVFCLYDMLHYLLISVSNENGTRHKQDVSAAGQKKVQTSIRTLRGHSGAITALHCVTKREVWDLVGDREDAGFLISGSTDCTVRSSICGLYTIMLTSRISTYLSSNILR